ncbi:hypothetical protein J4219_02390 [Candidatus Woesearchaeota archaeon]|nr:hypothetical protein [Candidatus Woesearchaeota archaeon]
MSGMPRQVDSAFLDYWLKNCDKLELKADDSVRFMSGPRTLRELVEEIKRDTVEGKAFYRALTLDPQVIALYEEFKTQQLPEQRNH